jgi:peptidoglycan hydrolase-like protein with peptidoglycan-binding domain
MAQLQFSDLTYFWLGPLGALRQLPLLPIRGNTNADEDVIGSLVVSLNGTGTQYVFGHKRSWQLDWPCLTADEVGPLRAMFLRLDSRALRIIDPRERNRLTRDGCSGGSYSRDATAHTVTAGTREFVEVTDYPAPYAGQVNGGIEWSVPATTVATMRVDDTLRTPLIPGETVTVSWLVKGTLGAQVGVRQYDAAGATTDSLASSVTLGAWSVLSHTLTPTSSQVSASLALTVASGAARTVTVGPAQWEKGADVSGWVPGSGCPVVVAPSMTTRYPGLAHVDPGLVLREV